MTHTRAKPSNRRGERPRGAQPKLHITLPDGDEFWPIGGVAYGTADRLFVPKYRGRR
jgi:hypothetical protein